MLDIAIKTTDENITTGLGVTSFTNNLSQPWFSQPSIEVIGELWVDSISIEVFTPNEIVEDGIHMCRLFGSNLVACLIVRYGYGYLVYADNANDIELAEKLLDL